MIALRLLFLTTIVSLCSFANAAEPAAFAVDTFRENFTSGGRKISVQTFAPRAPGRHPAVLVLHSSAGTLFGKSELQRFSRALAERGMVAFMVRYFDRTGTVFAGDKAINEHRQVWEETVADALDFASAHPRVRRDSIGAFGFSLGAFLAVSVASRDTRVDAVAELSGGIFDYLGGRLRRVPPLLIQHGTADQRVNVRYAHELAREARRLGTRPVVRLYPGEAHVLSKPALAEARTRALDFLQAQLRSRDRARRLNLAD